MQSKGLGLLKMGCILDFIFEVRSIKNGRKMVAKMDHSGTQRLKNAFQEGVLKRYEQKDANIELRASTTNPSVVPLKNIPA